MLGPTILKRLGGSWQVWAGQRLVRDFGNDETSAKDVARLLRELHPTEWARIGSPRPVVEYGLINGRPPVVGGFPKMTTPIDLRAVRVEAVKGVWCLRDDDNILFNFGTRRADAEQALAVVRKYGFNRIGLAAYPNPVIADKATPYDAAGKLVNVTGFGAATVPQLGGAGSARTLQTLIRIQF